MEFRLRHIPGRRSSDSVIFIFIFYYMSESEFRRPETEFRPPVSIEFIPILFMSESEFRRPDPEFRRLDPDLATHLQALVSFHACNSFASSNQFQFMLATHLQAPTKFSSCLQLICKL